MNKLTRSVTRSNAKKRGPTNTLTGKTPKLTPNDIDRWNARVDKTSSPSGCHIWLGAGHPKGGENPYGRFRAQGIQDTTHRWIAYMTTETLKAYDQANHEVCGNGMCVNPEHIVVSDQSRNGLDTVRHGRHPHAVLNSATAFEVRVKYADGGVTMTELAVEYGVTPQAISQCVNGWTWPDAGGPIKGGPKRAADRRAHKGSRKAAPDRSAVRESPRAPKDRKRGQDRGSVKK